MYEKMLNFIVKEIQVSHFSPTSLANARSLKTPMTGQISWELPYTVSGSHITTTSLFAILQYFLNFSFASHWSSQFHI